MPSVGKHAEGGERYAAYSGLRMKEMERQMKTLYIECNMGAAGDMLLAALLELMPDREKALKQLNGMGIPGVVYTAEPSEKCGICGTHIHVLVHGQEEAACEDGHEHEHLHNHGHDHHEHHHGHDEHAHDHDHDHHEHHHDHDEHVHDHDHHHDHSHENHNHAHGHSHQHFSLKDVQGIIENLNAPQKVKADASAVYRLIAQAESKVHGAEMDQIHFHEVGTMDAVADVAGCCLLFHELRADQIIASPIHVGYGTVWCAHGQLPVPAPATALILQEIPTYGGEVRGELCTPTGAALLKYFAEKFEMMPMMAVDKIGYGMGTKDFERANCIRVMEGSEFSGGTLETAQRRQPGRHVIAVDQQQEASEEAAESGKSEIATGKESTILEMVCNLDDMTGEELGYAAEAVLAAGALDVFTEPIYMKKNRPAVKFTVIVRPEDKERMAEVIFRNTTTIGIRMHECRRFELERKSQINDTKYGPMESKISEGFGVCRKKVEYEDLHRIAQSKGKTLLEIKQELYQQNHEVDRIDGSQQDQENDRICGSRKNRESNEICGNQLEIRQGKN